MCILKFLVLFVVYNAVTCAPPLDDIAERIDYDGIAKLIRGVKKPDGQRKVLDMPCTTSDQCKSPWADVEGDCRVNSIRVCVNGRCLCAIGAPPIFCSAQQQCETQIQCAELETPVCVRGVCGCATAKKE